MVKTLLDDILNYVFMDVIVDVILTTKSLKYVLYSQECQIHMYRSLQSNSCLPSTCMHTYNHIPIQHSSPLKKPGEDTVQRVVTTIIVCAYTVNY